MRETGRAFIKERVILENALYGGEKSATDYFRDFSYCNSEITSELRISKLKD